MRFLICDDEENFAQDLRQRILGSMNEAGWRLSVECVSDADQMPEIDITKYDVAFLDIDMGALSGIELARQMRARHPDLILVFVTNYVEYSLDGYEVKAFRYLLKSQLEKKLPLCLKDVLTAYRKERSCIRLFSDNVEIDVLPTHIVFAQTEGRRLKIHLTQEPREVLMVSMTMKDLMKLLQNRGFLRIHKSYLVNMAYIQQMSSTGVWLTDATKLCISARNYQELKHEYLRWKGMKRWSM